MEIGNHFKFKISEVTVCLFLLSLSEVYIINGFDCLFKFKNSHLTNSGWHWYNGAGQVQKFCVALALAQR